MLQAAANLDFETAAQLRDRLFELQGRKPEAKQETTQAQFPKHKRTKSGKKS